MAYLEYQEKSKLVVAIHKEEPKEIEEGYKIAESSDFKVGDEYEFIIYVNEVNEEGFVTSSARVRQNPKVVIEQLKETMQELNSSKARIDSLERGSGIRQTPERGYPNDLMKLKIG